MRDYVVSTIERLKDRVIPAICVPVFEKNRAGVERVLGPVLMNRPDIIEFRADGFSDLNEAVDACMYVRSKAVGIPMIFTFRSKGEGGASDINGSRYTDLLVQAADMDMADIIDVECLHGEIDVPALIDTIHENGAAVIGSFHNFCETPGNDEMLGIFKKEDEMGADVLKLAAMPNEPHDVLRLMDVTMTEKESCDKPIVTMSMGDMGRISRVAGSFTKSCMTFGCVGRASAPGQIEVNRLRRELCSIVDFCGV